MKTPKPMYQTPLSIAQPLTGTTQNPSAMRKALNDLALLAVTGLSMLLFVAAPLHRADAQCNTDVSGPVTLTVNFTSNTAILNQAALAGVVNPVDGSGCAGCLLWIQGPGDVDWVSSLTLSCDNTTPYGPGTYKVKANTLDPDVDPTCNSAEVDVVISFNDVTNPVIIDGPQTTVGGGSPPIDNSSFNIPIVVNTSHQSITDINLSIQFTHDLVNEARFELFNPSLTTSVVLYNQECGGPGIFSVTFDDEGPAATCPGFAAGGKIQSFGGNLSAFDGQNPNGTWILQVSDLVLIDPLTVSSTSITINENVPECGDVFSLNTGSNYKVIGGGDVQAIGSSAGDCSAQLAFHQFSFLDNCDLASLAVTFSAPVPAETPNSLPANFTLTGNNTIDLFSNDAANTTFHSSSTTGIGTTRVTFTLTDEAGLTSNCFFDVQVTDNEIPNIACPANVTKGTDAPDCIWTATGLGMTETGWTLTPSAGSYNDNCDIVSFSYSIVGVTAGSGTGDVNGIEFANGVSTVTYEVEDADGNVNNCSFTVTVDDDDNPTISCPADQTRFTSADGLGNCTYVASGDEFDYTDFDDNCPGAFVDNDYDLTSSLDGSTFNRGTTTIVWTVTDAAGNVDDCSFTITVIDDEEPLLTGSCPSDVTLPALTDGCENLVAWNRPDQLDWTDNCDASNLLVVTETISDPTVQAAINNNFPYDFTSGDSPLTSFPVGVTTITYEVEDLEGNTNSCSFTVTIEDQQAPVIICGGDQTIGTICELSAIPDYTGNVAAVNENCPGYTITQSPPTGTTLGAIFAPAVPQNNDDFIITLTVTDDAGLTGTCVFTVTLADNDLPVPTVAILPVIEPATTLGTDCGPFMLCAPTATDCNGTTIYGTATITGATFDPDGCGAGIPGYFLNASNNYSVLWTYDDGLGNIVTQTQQVNTFDDSTPPAIACPSNIVVDADPGVCTATGIAGIDITEIFPSTAPFLDPADFPAPGEVIDNCGVGTIFWSTSNGDFDFSNDPGTATYELGVNTVTVDVEDINGNTSSCSFTVTVEDNESPTLVCPTGPIALLTGSAGDDVPGDCGYTVAATDLSLDPSDLADNCPGAISSSYIVNALIPGATFLPGPDASSLAGSTFLAPPAGAGVFTVSWTISDANGNNGIPCIFAVSVTDDENPTIECPSSPIVRTTSEDGVVGDCFYTASGGEMDPISASDNCLVDNVFNNENLDFTLDGYNFAPGFYPITWTVEDGQGNFANCVITIVIEDDEAPVNTYCPSDITLVNIIGNCDNDVSWLRPHDLDWDDNCDLSEDLSVIEEVSDPGVQAAIDLNFPYDEDAAGSVPLTSFPVGMTTITYTATDAAGNMNVCSFTVTILDNEAPSITCPSDQILPTICATGVVPDYRPLATNVQDNCPASLIITQDPAAGTPLNLVPGLTPADGETFTVTLTVTDGLPNGLSTDCTFGVTLDEQNLPVPNVALLAPASSTCSVLDLPAPTANDCGNIINGVPNQGTLIQFTPPIYRFTTGIYNVIWTYVGASGNTIQTQQITVTDDNIAPDAQCKSLTVNLSNSAPGSVSVSAAAFDDGSSDNCVVAGFSFAVNGGSFAAVQTFGCDEVGIHTVELKVSDANGNESICNTNLTIQDITNPTIIGGCPSNISIGTSSNGNYDCLGLLDIIAPTASDNCDISEYTLTVTQPDLSVLTFDLVAGLAVSSDLQKGVSNAVLFVEDEHGLTSSCSFSITVTDDQAPTISCATGGSRNTSANLPGDCEYVIQGAEFDPTLITDNCPGVTVTNDLTGTSTLGGESLPVGIYTVTWTVEDAEGLQSQCFVAIQVIDDEAPVINFCQSNIVQTATAGTCNALVTWQPTYEPNITENCGIATLEESISDMTVIPVYPYNPNGPYPPFLQNQGLFPVGTTTVSYTVTDVNGNSSVCSFTVQITDDEAPVIVCPPNQILNTICATGSVPNYTGLINSLTDNCPGSVILTQSPLAGTALSAVPGLTPTNGATFTVTLTATDGNPAGLSTNCSFLVTLNDINLPIPTVASLPPLTSNCEGLVVSPPTANDCGTTIVGIPDKGIQISFMPPEYLFEKGLYTVIWTYIGTNGSTQQSQQIEVTADIVPPVVVCKNATVVLSPGGTATIIDSTVTSNITDNCGVASTSVVPSSFTCAQVGPNTVTVTALDAKGNSSSCTATVTIQDQTAPTFNIASSTITASCASIPGTPTVTPSDACGIASFNTTETSTKGGNAANCNFYNYTITRTWVATDVNGNSSSVTQVVVVSDNTAPAWTTAMPDTVKTVTNAFDCEGPVVLIIDALKVGDNCAAFSNLTITHVKSNGSPLSGGANASGLYPIGATNVTFTVTDPCGNSTVRTVVVLVEDKTLPTPVCVNGITLPLNPQGELVIPAQIIDKGSYDNCLTPFSNSDISLSVFPDSFDCSDAGKTIIVTLTVTDAAGNTATCPASVTIIDNTPPSIISCAPDVTVDCSAPTDTATLGIPLISDPCGTTLSHTDNLVQVGGAICRRIDRTWRVTDASGNTLQCIQRINITDNLIPTFTSVLPADVTVLCGSPIPSPVTVVAVDNCGTPISNFTVQTTKTTDLSCTDYSYVITRRWQATDACGNSNVHTQVVTVIDTLAPMISGLPDSVILFTNDFNADSCTVPVTLMAMVDDCQPDSVIDVSNDSPIGSGNSSASGSYSAGVYNITFEATDKCGNSSIKVVYLEVIDNSTPTAVCFKDLNVALNSQGFAVLTPDQVNNMSHDNCTLMDDLLLELSQDSFDCTMLGTDTITLTVTDEAGNFNTCQSIITVTAGAGQDIITSATWIDETFAGAKDGSIDVSVSGGSGTFSYLWTPGGAITQDIDSLSSGIYTLEISDLVTGCKKTISVFVGIAGQPIDTISGRILTPLGVPVALVTVTMAGSQTGTVVTGPDGRYQFTVPSGSDVTITPAKSVNPYNGVTALDFAIIQQHILGINLLTAPWGIIAADENGNNAINGIDIAQYQTALLTPLATFVNAPSWVFVDAAFTFPDPLQPWGSGWPAAVTFTNISGNKPNTDFVGVKMGDVNNNANPLSLKDDDAPGEVRSSDELELILPEMEFKAGERVMVPVFGSNFNDILAYQFSWQFDAQTLQFHGIIPGTLPGLSESQFSTQQVSSGTIPTVWFHNVPTKMAPNSPLYYLEFDVIRDGRVSSAISLGGGHLGRLAYDQLHEEKGIKLNFHGLASADLNEQFKLIGNRPNPFSDITNLEFILPEALEVSITITDLTGRAVNSIQTEGLKGFNAIPITTEQLPAQGMYLYILKAGDHQAIGKISYQN